MESIASAIETGRLRPPYREESLARWVERHVAIEVARELAELDADDMKPRHLSRLLRVLAEERTSRKRDVDRVQLVFSGLDGVAGWSGRKTSVVVDELFASAKHSLLIVTYALDRGEKAKALFGALARRMDTEPALEVSLFVNVHRDLRDPTPTEDLVSQFGRMFRDETWPGERLPTVYHFPRSLEVGSERASLHAKCVVVDDEAAFITSANFTEAAQERNLESGVIIRDASAARAIRRQLEGLIEQGELVDLLIP